MINHYSHEGGSITDGSWQVVATLEPPDNQTKPIAVSLVQNTSGELDTVSRVRPQRGNDFIVGYEFDPTSSSWTPASVLKSDHGPIIANNSGDDSNNDDNGNGHHQDPGSGNVLQGG